MFTEYVMGANGPHTYLIFLEVRIDLGVECEIRG